MTLKGHRRHPYVAIAIALLPLLSSTAALCCPPLPRRAAPKHINEHITDKFDHEDDDVKICTFLDSYFIASVALDDNPPPRCIIVNIIISAAVHCLHPQWGGSQCKNGQQGGTGGGCCWQHRTLRSASCWTCSPPQMPSRESKTDEDGDQHHDDNALECGKVRDIECNSFRPGTSCPAGWSDCQLAWLDALEGNDKGGDNHGKVIKNLDYL
jgi:hypothetical protein